MFKKILILCSVISGIALFVGRPLLLCAENIFSSFQCDTIIENTEVGKAEGKLFIKGKKVRMETKAPGPEGINMITLYDGQKAFVYFPEQNMAMTTLVSQVEQQVPMADGQPELNKKIVGQEIVDGRLCDIYEFSQPRSGLCKVWIARDINFPVKSETGGTKTYYKNIRTDVALDDGLFELPQGVQLQDMGGLQQQAGGMGK